MENEVVELKEQPNNFFELMAYAMKSENSIEIIERLYALKERDDAKEAEKRYHEAMVRAQQKIPQIKRDAENKQTNSSYARLETIDRIAKPIYTAEGFSLSFYEEDSSKENHIRVVVDIMHIAGHKTTKHADIPIDSAGIKGTVNKTLTHATTSSYTYGIRRLTCMVFNIPTGEDDDGNGAGGIKFISTDQATFITDEVTEIYRAKAHLFWEFMGVESADQVTVDNYEKAINALKRAREQVEGK